MPGRGREYSKRLGVISDAQLHAALDRSGLGTLVSAESVPLGLFGQNIFVTASSGEYVLRGAPHYPLQFVKERFFTRLLHEGGVPVPWPWHLDDAEDIFGWRYAIMPRVAGTQVGDPDVWRALDDADRIAVMRALGEMLARIHAITSPSFGSYDHEHDTIAAIETPFADWAIARLRRWLDMSRAASRATTDADVAWVDSVVTDSRHAVEVPVAPAFVHSDYKENNLVAARADDGSWRVTGVFDVGDAYFGDPEEDFSRVLSVHVRADMRRAHAFLDAYRSPRDLRPGYRERYRMYMLTDRLIIWEYGQRNGIWFRPGMTLREWAEPFLDADPFGGGNG
jgi:aminoglycoside phosphotransferase (APT) family kinase protein